MSTRPKRRLISSTDRATASESALFVVGAKKQSGDCARSGKMFGKRSEDRSISASFAPEFRKARATAAPRLPAAPVTMATWPLKSNFIIGTVLVQYRER